MLTIDKQIILDYHEALGQIWEEYEKLDNGSKGQYRFRKDGLEDRMEVLENIINGKIQQDIIRWTEILKEDESLKSRWK